jgi:hypothetical protein
MSAIHPIRLAVACGAAAAMLLGGSAAPAHAIYPPVVSAISASHTLTRGYATVTVVGHNLSSSTKVKATYKKRSTSKSISLNSARTVGTARLKVSSILPSTAGRYKVTFTGAGSRTTRTYTIGTAVALQSVQAVKTSTGIKVTGKARKGGTVRITLKRGTRTIASTSRSCNGAGSFRYTYTGTKKGTYRVTVKYIATKSYFGAYSVTRTVKR